MNKFSIVAMGPGSLDYTTPMAMKKIMQAETVMGASRLIETVSQHMATLGDEGGRKKYIRVDARLSDLKAYIETHSKMERIAVLVTGDSGFYSLLGYLSKNFKKDQFEVVPGISSLQYLFSCIQEQWAGAPLMSLHGRSCPYLQEIENHRFVGLLTDKVNTPTEVAKALVAAGHSDVILHVGSNLTYDDESIWHETAERVSELDPSAHSQTLKYSDLCVIVLENPNKEASS